MNRLFNNLFKRHLTIKTKYNTLITEDVIAFEKACKILEEQGVEFRKGSEIVATELGKKIYLRYSIITDIIIWIVIPLLTLIILI